MSEPLENRLQELFAELRDEDVRNAPPFSTSLAAALARTRRSSWSWRRTLPVAAAMLAIAAVLLWQQPSGPLDTMPATGGEIADWVAPSNALLQSDDPGLLDLTEQAVGDDPLLADTLWDLPSDTLLQDAEATFGEEIKL